jgi:hypothetical protein
MLPRVQKGVKERTLTLPSELPCWGVGVLLNLQRAIAGIKTQWIEEFFISLKSY